MAGLKKPRQTLKQTDDAVSFMSSIKGSTSKIMKLLTRRQFDVPNNISDSDPNFIHLTRMNAEGRQTQLAVTDYPSRIQETVSGYLQKVDYLDALSRSGREEAQKATSGFAAYKADATERLGAREELTKNLLTFLKGVDETFIAIVNALKEKKSDAEIRALFTKVEGDIKAFSERTKQVNRNEELSQKGLDAVDRKLTSTVEAESLKEGIRAPEAIVRRPQEGRR